MNATLRFMLLVVVAEVPAVHAAPRSDAAVMIRTYNYAVVPAEHFDAAKLEADDIFKTAGVSLRWIECRVPGNMSGAQCTEPLVPRRDLMLRLVDRPSATGERIVPLGESMLDRELRGGVLMTVDLSPVRTIAAGTATKFATLLGRAIAHEVGHLLLGSAQHTRLGLMRALWSHDELRGLRPAHWGFSAREAARLRAALHIAAVRQAESGGRTAPTTPIAPTAPNAHIAPRATGYILAP
jgi:hypothetical protein